MCLLILVTWAHKRQLLAKEENDIRTKVLSSQYNSPLNTTYPDNGCIASYDLASRTSSTKSSLTLSLLLRCNCNHCFYCCTRGALEMFWVNFFFFFFPFFLFLIPRISRERENLSPSVIVVSRLREKPSKRFTRARTKSMCGLLFCTWRGEEKRENALCVGGADDLLWCVHCLCPGEKYSNRFPFIPPLLFSLFSLHAISNCSLSTFFSLLFPFLLSLSWCDLQVTIPRGKCSSLALCYQFYFDQSKDHSMITRPFLLLLSLSFFFRSFFLPSFFQLYQFANERKRICPCN